jgi:hypothetical protein
MVTLTLTHTGTIPDATKVDVHWGDGAVEIGLPWDIATSNVKPLNHEFMQDGLANTTVRIYNDASSVEEVIEVRLNLVFESVNRGVVCITSSSSKSRKFTYKIHTGLYVIICS